ncbi:pilus assembly protein CpaC [Prauserella marina]|uniref:Acyl-CoA dehydrogenase n=1 Tax=Prauserella marina TaxID=530584 RepID=A0A222VU16_9PSEU|nr:acyl-CoA dehydrogenase family protein [Prauserella marina]ASR37398.1 pilus assembly protein CpaC [Prauserella marina]PWV74727.1 alkylation response protein AidB-like acyl-CoA dehydrogenase [Prauserella marina]SDD42289.1 Acyl-CoA dehydrogenase [Prauserella marina]
MEFSIPDELAMFVESVRRFREKELMPLEQDFLLAGRFDAATRTALENRARRQGFWALDVPEEYGGQGMGVLASCLVAEELFKHPAMFEFGGSPEPVLYHGTEDQKARFLYPVVKEDRRCCYAFTEPGGGSDVAALRTTAVRDGDDWVINGTKTFISHAERADFVILFATIDPAKGARGVTCFLVDKGTPGFELSRPIPTMGDDWEPHELTFTDCVVPDANRLGEVGGGWKLATSQLTHGRLKIAAYQLGIARRCVDIAVEWAKRRVTWGKPIATRQAVQWMLADSVTELEAARMLTYRAAWLADEGEDCENEAFMAKLYATEMAQRVTDRCLQILGGLGYSKELPIQSFYRQVRVWRIGHGTAEIHRWMIARNLLGLSARD